MKLSKKPPARKPSTVTTIRMPDELKANVEKQAAKENRSFMNLMITFAKEGMARRSRGGATSGSVLD